MDSFTGFAQTKSAVGSNISFRFVSLTDLLIQVLPVGDISEQIQIKGISLAVLQGRQLPVESVPSLYYIRGLKAIYIGKQK